MWLGNVAAALQRLDSCWLLEKGQRIPASREEFQKTDMSIIMNSVTLNGGDSLVLVCEIKYVCLSPKVLVTISKILVKKTQTFLKFLLN